jgi:hypothetical protein
MFHVVIADDLSAAERRLWDAFPTGRMVDFGPSGVENDDPADGDAWGPDRQVRAEVLAALLCGTVEVEPGEVGEVHVRHARITGELGSPGVTFKYRLRLNQCHLGDGIDLTEGTIRSFDLRGCHIGAIRLRYTKINGTFRISDARLDSPGGPALTAQDLTVT